MQHEISTDDELFSSWRTLSGGSNAHFIWMPTHLYHSLASSLNDLALNWRFYSDNLVQRPSNADSVTVTTETSQVLGKTHYKVSLRQFQDLDKSLHPIFCHLPKITIQMLHILIYDKKPWDPVGDVVVQQNGSMSFPSLSLSSSSVAAILLTKACNLECV